MSSLTNRELTILSSLPDSHFIYRGSLLGRESLYTFPPPDPDFEYFKIQKKQAVGQYYRELANLDVWVHISANIGMGLDEWLSHDDYWQEAISQAVGAMVEARNKKSKEESEQIMKQINDAKGSEPYVSPFAASGTRPTFQMS